MTDFQNFDCKKGYIEQIYRPTQKNLLIELYCGGNFDMYNLVDLYYRSLGSNAIVMFLIICAIYPVLFMFVGFIADKYLSVGMQDLSDRFKLSPTLAAVTLIAFANGAPDVLSSMKAGKGGDGPLVSLASLYGGFIFSATLVICNVVWNAGGNVKLPKLAVLKELGFYFLSVCVIIGFGIYGYTGFAFLGVYAVLYVAYILTTIAIEKFADPEAEDDIEDELQQGRAGEEIGSSIDDFSVNKSKPYETEIEIEEQDDELHKAAKDKNVFELIVDEVVDPEASFIENLVIMPLAIGGMLTISYLENPLMKTPLKYAVIGASLFWIMMTMNLMPNEKLITLIIVVATMVVFLFLDLVKINKNIKEILWELLSVFSAIGWINIISAVIVDFIKFLAFYFNINQVILSAMLLSAGNTIGDFFGNGALAKAGSAVMGGIASYSGQIFNNFVGFAVTIVASQDFDFDIFTLNDNGEDAPEDTPMPVASKYIIIIIVTVLLLLLLSTIYLFANNFTLKKGYTFVLLSFYGVFFGGSLAFGIYTSNAP